MELVANRIIWRGSIEDKRTMMIIIRVSMQVATIGVEKVIVGEPMGKRLTIV